MSDALPLQHVYRAFVAQIQTLIASNVPVVFDAESAFAVQLERAPLSDNHGFVSRLIEISSTTRLPEMVVVDRLGYQRPVYRPLLIYAWIMAFREQYETLPRTVFSQWDEALRAWCELLEATVADQRINSETAWSALAIWSAGKLFIRDSWTDLASSFFGRLHQSQQSDGSLLQPSASTHPEIFWQEQLAMLHALASFAVQAEDRTAADSVQRASQYVLNEVQPDHATRQPWGLFAFIWNEPTRAVADHLLHTLALQQPVMDPVSRILLTDSLYCLRLFL